ncbi:MAG: glycosyltransferase family 39 protein [Anaerolineales bacterium]|nr:glycosyltransferase family 39 protein [Anaerolineales bacterium]MCB9145546.1 glycosyltransferase family 39 protein [Anaerolineales bacterium]
MKTKFTNLLPWYFFAAAFQSLLAAIALLRVPSEGLSLSRLALFAGMGIVFIFGIGSGLYARRNLLRFDWLFTTPIISSATLLSLTLGLTLFLLRYLNPERLLPFYERLAPLLWLFFFLTLEATLLLLLIKNGFSPSALTSRGQTLRAALLPLGILLAVFLFVAITRVGVTPDTGYWGEPGVAIQGWQFILALLAGMFAFALILKNSSNSRVANMYLPLTIYLIAAALWLSVPLETLANSFYAPISPPVNVPLPYSDAGYYDYLAQSLLIGHDYFGGIPPRPLYVAFLTLLHLLFGQNYPAMISAQVLVMACFPVALYFLAKKMHSPAAGVTVALFAIFREFTSLWISSNTRVTNSKMFTTDFPTAFAIVIISLVILWWLERRDTRSTIMAGGAFGLLLLFRTQSTLTLPFLFLLVLLVLQLKWTEWLKAGILFAAAMLLVVLPWLMRNYMLSGHFSFDDPSQVAVIYSQYSFTGNLDLSQYNPETDSVRERIISFTLENPGYVANFITSHFLNTEIGGLLALPLIKPFNGFQEPPHLYWVSWDGTLEWYNIILVLFYLCVAALGVASAWRKMKWLGLVPIAFNLGYALSNGIARFSSWRYNMPIDWVFYFYFALGIAELFGLFFLAFGKQADDLYPASPAVQPETIVLRGMHWRQLLPLLGLIFIGASPWLMQGLAQPRFTSTPDELAAKLEANGHSHEEVANFLAQPNAFIAEGRLLFPRLYRKGDGLASANPWTAYKAQDFARIGFLLVNARRSDMIFPTRDMLEFQQGADVVVLACSGDNDLTIVRLIQFEDAAYQSAPLLDPCP